MTLEKQRDRRRQLMHAEGRTAMQAQQAGRANASLDHLGLRLIHVSQNPSRPDIERLALGRELQAARRPLQQARTQAVFEAGHQLGKRRWRKTQLPRRSRKPAAIHRANKSSHFSSTIHRLIMDQISQMFFHLT